MEKRLAGLGTPVFRLMLKRRDSKPKPKMPDAMIADFRLQSKGGGNEKRQLAPAKQCRNKTVLPKVISESVSDGEGSMFSFHGSPQKCSLRKGQKYLVGMEI